MKIFGLLLAALLAGTAVGVGSSMATFRSAHDRLTVKALFPDEGELIPPGGIEDYIPTSPDPQIMVDQEEFDFGEMENGEHSEHTYVIANDGGSPLEIELLKISCGCTNSDLEVGKKVIIPPGETYDVELSWYANARDGHFRQAATFSTNDPRRPQVFLVVSGNVVKGVTTEPPGFLVHGISVGQSAERELRILSYRDTDFKITGFEFSGGGSAEYYDVSFDPLTEDQISSKKNVQAGVKAKLTIKPGLPAGTVNHVLLVKTNDPKKPEISLGINGTIDGPVSISGPRWNAASNRLAIGPISREEGYKTTLLLKIVDVDPKLLDPKIEEIYPASIEVHIGKARVINSPDRTVVMYPITVDFPPNGPVLTNLGTKQGPLGNIDIDTGHEETGKVHIGVEVVTVD